MQLPGPTLRFVTTLIGTVLLAVTCCGWMQPAHAQTGTVPDEGIRFQPPQAVLLQGAHIVCSTRQEFEHADLLIRDGKIVAVGEELAVPPGAKVIDCFGRFLYPALVDALVEVESDRSQLLAGYWNDQVTPQHRVAQTIEIDSARLVSLRKAGIGAFLAAPKGGLIKGQSCVLSTADASLAQCVLRPVAFQHFQLYPSARSRDRYPNSPMGAVALVRQALYDADWYAKAQRAVAADRSLPTPEHNVALESLGPALVGTQSVVVDGNNELYALRADRLAREFALRLVIRGSGREYRQMDAVAATRRTIIVPVDFPAPPDVGTQDELASATLQSLMHWRLAPENPGRLEKSGVSFVITSDGLSKATDLIPNVRKAIEYGLTPETALYALTEGPAKLLQIDQLTGTLQAGMLANLLLCDGPLFEEKTEIIET